MMALERPQHNEHDPYYRLYIDQAPDGNILETLDRELAQTLELLTPLSEQDAGFRYEPGKWSIREVIGHLIDTEWMFTYRGLSFARADPAELPGFDQTQWVRDSNTDRRTLSELLSAFRSARQASRALFVTFTDEEWLREGTANGCPFTVRTMPFLLAGHEAHHRKILIERYLQP